MLHVCVVIIVSTVVCSTGLSQESPVQLVVRADQPGAAISPTMWGIFFEDINFGADGGLYAELVKNRSFEFPDALMRSLDEIAGVCEGTPYNPIIRKYGPTVESEGSLFRLEIALDHFYYQNLLAAIEGLDPEDRAIALRLVGVRIDLQNVDWIIRLRSFYDLPLETVLAAIVPGGFHLSEATIRELYGAQNVTAVLQDFVRTKYPGLAALLSTQVADSVSRLLLIRRIMEEILRQEVQRILAGYPFTVGILLAYFLLKRNELEKIRIILNAQQQGLQAQRIESMI